MESLEIGKLREMEISTLKTMGQSYGIEDCNSFRKDELIARILEVVSEKNIPLYGKGVLQILDDRDQNYGFLRSPRSNYFQSDEDIYVSSSQNTIVWGCRLDMLWKGWCVLLKNRRIKLNVTMPCYR